MSALHQLALTYLKNIGPTLAKSLIAQFGSAEKVFEATPAKLLKIQGIGDKTVKQLNFKEALLQAEKELKFVEKNNIQILFYADSAYPKRLKNCHDSPILLYYKGNADLNTQRIISIVGTRNATEYGKNLCRQLIEELQKLNILVVSGLALGIDGAVHKECLKYHTKTVGVLGHGLDKLYPSQNRLIAEKMVDCGGLLSEYPSGTMPDRENFPQRNRIVAGIADAIVVVEASVKGGALITAEIANSYNRDVFAFPGRIGDEFSEGCNFLIRNNKAALLSCVADLGYVLGWENNIEVKRTQKQLILPLGLTVEEELIFETIRLNNSPLPIDDLTIKTKLTTSQLAMNLLNMEMQGIIKALPGKIYTIGG